MAGGNGSTVTAGPITFVVEHVVVQDGVETGGPTVRVLGGDDDHEYLRLRMFNVGPTTTTSRRPAQERILMLDTVAEGDTVGGRAGCATGWADAGRRRRTGPGRRARRAGAGRRGRRRRVARAEPARNRRRRLGVLSRRLLTRVMGGPPMAVWSR